MFNRQGAGASHLEEHVLLAASTLPVGLIFYYGAITSIKRLTESKLLDILFCFMVFFSISNPDHLLPKYFHNTKLLVTEVKLG